MIPKAKVRKHFTFLRYKSEADTIEKLPGFTVTWIVYHKRRESKKDAVLPSEPASS
jgi:hypothetical protein